MPCSNNVTNPMRRVANIISKYGPANKITSQRKMAHANVNSHTEPTGAAAGAAVASGEPLAGGKDKANATMQSSMANEFGKSRDR